MEKPGRKVCEAMRGLAHSTRRRVVMYQLGEDEKQLLYSTSLVQNGKSELACRRLGPTVVKILAKVPLDFL